MIVVRKIDISHKMWRPCSNKITLNYDIIINIIVTHYDLLYVVFTYRHVSNG